MSLPFPWTHAAYRSDCPLCGDLIDPGDVTYLTDYGWTCETCAADEAEEEWT